MIKRIIVFLAIFCLMTTCLFSNIVNSVSTSPVLLSDFDHIASGTDTGTEGEIAFKNMGPANKFETSTDNPLSGINSFNISEGGYGWWNLTIPRPYISEFNLSFYCTNGGMGVGTLSIEVSNSSTLVMNLRFSNAMVFEWFDVGTGWHTIAGYSINTRYYVIIKHNSLNNFNVTLKNGAFAVLGSHDYAGATAPNYATFTKVYLSTAGAGLLQWNLDNFYITTVSTSGGTGSTYPYGECIDFSNYSNIYNMPISGWVRTGLQTSYKYLELSGTSKMSAKIQGYKLLVYKYQLQDDPDLTHYGMYINGQYVGTPSCSEVYDERADLLVWDVSPYNLRLENETPIFEFYHDVNTSTHSFAWYLEVIDMYDFVGPPAYYTIADFYKTSHIDGAISLNPTFSLACHPNWMLYYGEISTSVNPGYTNGIDLLDSSQLPLGTHSLWNIPFSYVHKTIFFDVYVDQIEKYKLYVYDNNNVLTGTTQYYPKDMLLYHSVYGFIPYAVGNYTVQLKEGATVKESRKFNVTDLNEYYSLWTYPNPSKTQSTVTIGVYASTPSLYTYYKIGIFYKIGDINTIEKAYDIINIPYFTNNYYYLETYISLSYGSAYLRLFASNNTIFFPITGIHQHFIQGETVFNRIWTSLLDNNNIGFINEEFKIYYTFNVPLIDAQIFWNDQPIKQVKFGSSSFMFSYDQLGTYQLTLKMRTNNTWTLVPGCTLLISLIEKGQGEETVILPQVGSTMGYIVGLIITMFCMLSPLIIVHGLHANVGVPALAYALCGGIGLAVSTGLGFFPFWIIAFVTIIGVLIVVVKYVFNSGSGSE